MRFPEGVQPRTVYFGGGTPSVLPARFFQSFLEALSTAGEVTVEVNPEDADKSYLTALKQAGVNRISIGVQSFHDTYLKVLGRRHSAKDAISAVDRALSIFDNVSVDIMYGLPYQSLSGLESELKRLLEFPVKHVSAYALTVYKGTRLHSMVKNRTLPVPEEEELARMFYLIKDVLEQEGFVHYEISNFARNNYHCRHNISYWKLKNYAGLGPSAVSLIDGCYAENIRSVKGYIERLSHGRNAYHHRVCYTCDEIRQLNLAMGLRLLEGVDLASVSLKELFESALSNGSVQALLDEGYLVYEEPVLKLGRKGLFLADGITATLCTAMF